MKCDYQYKCKFATSDDLCNEFAENCRIRNKYLLQQQLRKESEAELNRMHQENDIGLTRFCQQVRESSNAPQRFETSNPFSASFPHLTPADIQFQFKREIWNEGKVV